jgi:hypothetical protein
MPNTGKYAFQAFRHSRLAFHTRPSSGTALQAAAFVYVLNALLRESIPFYCHSTASSIHIYIQGQA